MRTKFILIIDLTSKLSVSLVKNKVNLKESKLHWLIATRWLEAKASWIYNWYNCEGHTCIGKISTTCAAIISKLNFEEILICDVSRVSSWLNTSDHELILRWKFFLNTFTFFKIANLVSDSVQIKHHFSLETTLSKGRAWSLIVRKSFDISVSATTESSCINCKSLFHKEFHLSHTQSAAGIIDVNHCFCNFLWCVDIFFVVCPHFWNSLINTTPCGNFTFLHLLFIHFEWYWGFSDCKNLLILHFIVFLSCMDCGLYKVLYLCLWALTSCCIFEIDWAWHS